MTVDEPPFTIEVKDGPGGPRVSVRGELDMVSSPRLNRELRRHPGAELDLSGVSFMDSTGLTVVLRAAEQDADFRLAPELPEQVRLVMRTTRVLERLPFAEQ